MCRKITSNWQPLFSKKMAAAAASFSYKIGGCGPAASFSFKIGSKDLATLLAAVLTWSGYWVGVTPTSPSTSLVVKYVRYRLYLDDHLKF